MEKTALHNNLTKDKDERFVKKIAEIFESGGATGVTLNDPETQEKMDKLRKPIEEQFRTEFQNRADKIDRDYQREKDRQEQVGEMLSRIAPTSSLTYSAMNLTQTGKLKRDLYFQMGERYYDQLNDVYFSEISDDPFAQVLQVLDRMNDSSESETDKIPPPPTLTEPALSETLLRSMVDVCLLGFFAIAFTMIAFLKFFRSDI